MRASTSTRWSKELPGHEGHEDTGGGNSIYSRWTLLPFITVTKAILSCGRIGGVRFQVPTTANTRKEQRGGALFSSASTLLFFTGRNTFQGVRGRESNRGQESYRRKVLGYERTLLIPIYLANPGLSRHVLIYLRSAIGYPRVLRNR